MKKLIPIITLLLLIPTTALAATHAAADCEQATVAAAIAAAADGDTVTIAAGSCTWTTGMAPGNKGLTIQGAGAGTTVITANTGTAWGSNPFFWEATSKTVRITAMTLNIGAALQSGGFVFLRGNGNTYRFDHLTLTGNSSTRHFMIQGYGTYGVSDNITATNIYEFALFDGGVSLANKYTNWTDTLTMGSADAHYVENNTFNMGATADGILDMEDGAKVVYRYNTANVSSVAPIGNHGADSVQRSGLLLEAYNNVFAATGTILWGVQLRGGTGVIFNNSFTGTWTAPIFFTNYRSCSGHLAGHPNFPACDGSGSKGCVADLTHACTVDGDCASYGGSCVSLDVNTTGQYGWPCLDQIGRGPSQASVPFYVWNNGKTVTVEGAPNCPTDEDPTAQDHIQSGRDYFVSTDSSGAKAGYSAYTCPHPSTGASGGCSASTAGTTGYGVATTHTVTPSTSTGCTILPDTAQTVGDGETIAFTLTAAYGYSITATGCTLSGSTCTTAAVTGNLAVVCIPAKHMMEGIGTGSGSITGIGTGSGTITLGN